MPRNKGVEMSLNLIILIVIALIVAAIIIYIVAKNTRSADNDISSCKSKGGECKETCDAGESGSSFFTGGCDDGTLCCTRPLAQEE
jgi:hypothetical protein